jgi:hypothetical protein
MRRHPQIPLSPQLAINGGLARSAAPKDKAIGLQGVRTRTSGMLALCHLTFITGAAAGPP